MLFSTGDGLCSEEDELEMAREIIKMFFKTIGWAALILCEIYFLRINFWRIKTGQADVWDYIFITADLGLLIIGLIFNPFTKKLRQKRKSKEDFCTEDGSVS